MKIPKLINYILCAILASLCVLSFILIQFDGDFEVALCWFLLSTICFFELPKARKPMQNFGFRNNLKRYFQSRNQLDQYEKLIIVVAIATLILAGESFIKGIIEMTN